MTRFYIVTDDYYGAPVDTFPRELRPRNLVRIFEWTQPPYEYPGVPMWGGAPQGYQSNIFHGWPTLEEAKGYIPKGWGKYHELSEEECQEYQTENCVYVCVVGEYDPRKAKSVEEYFGASTPELARSLNLTPTTSQRHIQTLAKILYSEALRDPDTRGILGGVDRLTEHLIDAARTTKPR